MLEAGLKRRPMLTPEAAVWALLPIALGEVGLVSTFQTRSMKAKCGRSIEIAVVQEPGVDFTRSVLEHSKETLLVHNLAREVAELCGNRSELVCEFLPFGAAQGSTVSDVSIHLNNIARFADLTCDLNLVAKSRLPRACIALEGSLLDMAKLPFACNYAKRC